MCTFNRLQFVGFYGNVHDCLNVILYCCRSQQHWFGDVLKTL